MSRSLHAVFAAALPALLVGSASGVALRATSGATAPAASLAVLRLFPASAKSLTLTWNLAESDARYLKSVEGTGTRDGLVELDALAHLETSDLAEGTIALARFEPVRETKPNPSAKASAGDGDAWSVLAVPVKSAASIQKLVHAQAAGSAQGGKLSDAKILKYRWKVDGAFETRFLAFRNGFALISRRRALLESVLKDGAAAPMGLEAEFAPLKAWMLTQDSVITVTERYTAKTLEDFFSTKGKGGSSAKLMASFFRDLGVKAKASVHHVALGLKFPDQGGLAITARAFFREGSPLASEGAALTPIQGHPLGALPEGPYAMAMGGQWPNFTRLMENLGGTLPNLKPEEQAALKELSRQAEAPVDRMAFAWQASKAGDPLFQGLSAVLELKDGSAWMQAMKLRANWLDEHLNGACTFEENILPDGAAPGGASFMVGSDLNVMTGGKVPPAQMAMIGGLLFGGPKLKVSYALLDEHRALCVFGDSVALRRMVTKVAEGKPLAASRPVQKADAMLPKDARLSMYLDPKGVRDLVGAVVEAFLPQKGATLPDPGAVTPLAGAFSMDAQGLQFSGVASSEALAAIAQVFTGVGKLLAPPAAAGPAPR